MQTKLNSALRNLTCRPMPTVSEIARLRTHCIYAKCSDSTFGCQSAQTSLRLCNTISNSDKKKVATVASHAVNLQ